MSSTLRRVCGSLFLALLASTMVSCEPIVDFTTPNDDSSQTENTDDGILRPTQAAVRPRVAVNAPADPLLQMSLLSNDSSKGWQLKKRLRKGLLVTDVCIQDDGIVLYQSKRIDFEAGAIKCNAQERDGTGVWQLTDRPSILISSNGETPYEAQILALSTNQLILSYTDDEGELIQDTYEPPVLQEPVGSEDSPIVLEPTPRPESTPTASASPLTEEEEGSPAPTTPGSGAFSY